ncbi:MAG TPA: LptF/LptG family permease [Gemmatimonadales bacterium]|nr:LptF/LptG family permease [Gemmatimonadales bacterium]
MRLLDRYLVRQFIPPLLFAFTAMTSIMLLNQVARRFGALVGKGLPWSVIGEVFLLCLPFIIAMTLPMAVLVAVLYTFSHLAADSEITAMRASGVSVLQLLRPMLLAGLVLTAGNFWFTDQVLPQSNARLRNLLINISRKKPTLELREQVINEIPPSGLFLRASRIDANSGRLRSVTIYDMAGTDSRRIIYADSGVMGFANAGADLQFRLFDGAIHAFKQTDPTLLQVTDFRINTILVKDVSNRLDLDASDGVRGDREMSTCEMMATVRGAEYDMGLAQERRRLALDRDLRSLLALPPTSRPRPVVKPAMPKYCDLFREIGARVGTAEPDSAAQPLDKTLDTPGQRNGPLTAPPIPRARPPVPVVRKPLNPLDNPVALPLQAVPVAPQQPVERPVPRITTWAEVSSARDEVKTSASRADQYLVEVHKKWAISVACLVFALVGIPMALRFPRGGMGLVIGGGLFVFAIYYVGLIAGEGLGNKDIVHPWIAMWAPNIIFATLGVFGMIRVSRESGSTRGGDLAELWETLTSRLRRRKAG